MNLPRPVKVVRTLKDYSLLHRKTHQYAQQLAAIAASPGDRLLRVQIADFLEEELSGFGKRSYEAMIVSRIWKKTLVQEFRLGVMPIGPFRWDVFVFLPKTDFDVREAQSLYSASHSTVRCRPWPELVGFPGECCLGNWTDNFQDRLVPSLEAARQAVPGEIRAGFSRWLLLARDGGWELHHS